MWSRAGKGSAYSPSKTLMSRETLEWKSNELESKNIWKIEKESVCG